MKIRDMLFWNGHWDDKKHEIPICVSNPHSLKKMVEKLEKEGHDSL